MRYWRGALGWVCLVAAGISYAGSGVWGPPTTINGYYTYSTGTTAYITTSSNQNPDGCANTTYLALDMSAANFKDLYTAVMIAQATGQTVTVRYNGCAGSYPLIDGVAIPHIW